MAGRGTRGDRQEGTRRDHLPFGDAAYPYTSSADVTLDSLILVTLSTAVCERAAMLEPHLLRSLDALHLAAALEIGDELEGLVTYDRHLAESARVLAVKVVAPM